MSYPNSVLPKGSLVLVTGATGLIGSVISRELLRQGLKVRGTTRTGAKAEPLKKLFDEQFGADNFEIAEVKDIGAPGALDAAMQGVSGLIHVATDVSFGTDPEVVVNGTVEFTKNVLASAAKTPSVKRVVLTSSGITVLLPEAGKKEDCKFIDQTTWNDKLAQMGWSLPADDPMKPMGVYAASKVEGEKAAWQFVKENKPSFILNSVLPNYVAGEILNPGVDWNSTAGLIRTALVDKNLEPALGFMSPPLQYVGVGDVARIHVGALLDPAINSERLWASAANFDINDILAIFRKHHGKDKVAPDVVDAKRYEPKITQPRSLEILKKFGRNGYESLEDVIASNIKGLVVA